jgi:hypothetical protein
MKQVDNYKQYADWWELSSYEAFSGVWP